MYSPFNANHFILKKQVLSLTGIFRFYDNNGTLVAYSKKKMFKLREDIRIYSDESESQEVLHIQARQVLDFSAAYDVYDSSEGVQIGALRRRGLRSVTRDQWDVLAPGDRLIGVLLEDSAALALVRRLLLGALLPQNYDMRIDGQRVMDLRQRFNLLRYQMDLTFFEPSQKLLDHRLGIAAGVLLAGIEGRQD